MSAILEQCGGIIEGGLCKKCYARSSSTGSRCTMVYEIIPPLDTKISPELEKYLNHIDELKDFILKNAHKF